MRQTIRHDTVMRALVSVSKASSESVKLTGVSGAKDGWIEVDVVDMSTGGLGFLSKIYLPRRAQLRVRILGRLEGSPRLGEFPVQIHRTIMTDRRPAYLVGTSFLPLNAAESKELESLMKLLTDD